MQSPSKRGVELTVTLRVIKRSAKVVCIRVMVRSLTTRDSTAQVAYEMCRLGLLVGQQTGVVNLSVLDNIRRLLF